MKYLILSLLLVVGMGASGQTKKIKHTDEYRELTGKIDFLLNQIINERILTSKLFDSLRGRNNMIEDQSQRDFIDIMQLGQRYWDLKRGFDSLRKEVDSLKIIISPSVSDSVQLGGSLIQNTTIFTSRANLLDSNGTYHDHMPTQLTVRKRHKRHKWVKKSPPATKD